LHIYPQYEFFLQKKTKDSYFSRYCSRSVEDESKNKQRQGNINMWGETDNTQTMAAPTGNPFSDPQPSSTTSPTRRRSSNNNKMDKKQPSPSSLRRDESLALGMTQDELQQHIQHNLTLIQNSIGLGEGMVDMLGTPSDSTSLRSRIRDVLGAVLSKINKTAKYLKDLGASDLRKKRRGSMPRAAGIASRKKLEKDLESLRQVLNTLERTYKLKARQYAVQQEPKNEGNPFAESSNNMNSAGEQKQHQPVISGVNGLVGAEGTYVSREQVQKRLQQQMLIEGETEVNEVMINERNDAMRKINHDLHEVREIFSDLATMVEDQDESIETIATNVEKSAIAAKQGRQQLEKANDQQKARCVVS